MVAALASSVILSAPAFYNGYPLVESDTGTYVESAFTLKVPPDRAVGYSLFLWVASLRRSLWLVVLVQAFLVFLLLSRVLRMFSGVASPSRALGVAMLLALTTVLPWYTSQVMPDIFIGIGVLVVALIATERETSWPWRAAYATLFILATLSHFSHLLVLTGMVPVVAAIRLWRPASVARTNVIALATLAGLSWLTLPAVNWILTGQPFVSASTHVFMSARLYRAGLLTRFLRDHCGGQTWVFCAVKDEPVRDEGYYIWHNDGPLRRLGGFTANQEELRMLVRDTIRAYPLEVARDAAAQFAHQLVLFRFDYLRSFASWPDAYVNLIVKQRFPAEFNRYIGTRQYLGDLPLRAVTTVNTVTVIISALLILVTVAGLAAPRIQVFILLALAGVVLNAAVCATLSLAHPRYQARVIWVVPLLAAAVALCRAERTRSAAEPGEAA